MNYKGEGGCIIKWFLELSFFTTPTEEETRLNVFLILEL